MPQGAQGRNSIASRMASRKWTIAGALLLIPVLGFAVNLASAQEPAVSIPPPAQDEAAPAGAANQTVVLAGGCFWGVQAVYQYTKGVTSAVAGYSGGAKETAHYEMVGTERTGHAEVGAGDVLSGADLARQILPIFFPVRMTRPSSVQGPTYGT